MFLNRYVLIAFLKFSTNVIALISVGILFQNLGPYTLNECTANVFLLHIRNYQQMIITIIGSEI